MADKMMVRGQALSTWQFSGSVANTDTPLFQDTRDPNALYPIRIQGFYWNGAAILTLKDAAGVVLFKRASTNTTIYPSNASGSYGLTVNVPLTMSVSATPPGGGGKLIIYGEVL